MYAATAPLLSAARASDDDVDLHKQPVKRGRQASIPQSPQVSGGEEYWPEKDVAAKYFRSLRALKEHRFRRTGPPFIANGKVILYRRSSLEKWLNAQEIHTQPKRNRGRRFDGNRHQSPQAHDEVWPTA